MPKSGGGYVLESKRGHALRIVISQNLVGDEFHSSGGITVSGMFAAKPAACPARSAWRTSLRQAPSADHRLWLCFFIATILPLGASGVICGKFSRNEIIYGVTV